jgi:ribonuclease P protein component
MASASAWRRRGAVRCSSAGVRRGGGVSRSRMQRAARGRATLPRGERLRERGEIERLFRRGNRLERPGFVLLWARADGRRAAAFTASRRIGGAVRRNRARRRLREAYRREQGILAAQAVRLCFVARPGAVELPFPDLAGQVADALRHAARRLTP